MKSPLEVTLPSAFQSIRPWPRMVPLTSAIDAFGQAGELLGLKDWPEGQRRDVERRMARAGRQAMLDGDVGHPRALGCRSVPVART